MSASEPRPSRSVRNLSPVESPIDLTELTRLGDTAANDPSRSFVHDIIELFLTLTPDIYKTARAAYADADAQSLARAAHKLKSQAAYFGARRMVSEDGMDFAAAFAPHADGASHEERCDYMLESGDEMGFAMGLLEARGELEMGSPEADAVAQAYVRSVIMHEVGHTLGLRHNFRSSTIYSIKQLQDAAFTKQNGMSGSVMDYTPFNLALKGERQGEERFHRPYASITSMRRLPAYFSWFFYLTPEAVERI
jgi:HPt (histidine-containing phosphotransfer) domain-containing protein